LDSRQLKTVFTKRHATRVIYRLTVQTLPDGLETQFTPPARHDADSTVLSCLAGGVNWAQAPRQSYPATIDAAGMVCARQALRNGRLSVRRRVSPVDRQQQRRVARLLLRPSFRLSVPSVDSKYRSTSDSCRLQAPWASTPLEHWGVAGRAPKTRESRRRRLRGG